MKKNYSIGLDIGTNSVGWAVLADDYRLIRKKMRVQGNTDETKIKKNFWGVRLFDEGQTAENRRLKRTNRRRISRRRNRLIYLQEIFNEEINQLDGNFFQRLDESFIVKNDKIHSEHPIFGTLEEELNYHEKYKTIYHLRAHIANATEKVDLRLVYLAVAHIIKYRGNFLIEGKLDANNSDVNQLFDDFLVQYNAVFQQQNNEENSSSACRESNLELISQEKISRSQKADKILDDFPEEKSTGTLGQFIKLIVGNQGNFKKTFNAEDDLKLQFSKEEYDVMLEDILAIIGDEYADVFASAKKVYEAIELSKILDSTPSVGKSRLSSSMIKRYSEHREDLKDFKYFIKNSLPGEYKEIFHDISADGYAGYIDGKISEKEFYTYIEKKIKSLSGSEVFIIKIKQEDFLRKQRTYDNGVIPHQLHLSELTAILDSQETYYSCIKKNKDKIKQLLTFRIPYYIGPLGNGKSQFSWLTRKNMNPIRPWNFSESIDVGKSASQFIERMTNKDTYLPTENVLSKHSLIYEKFMVFNELTKVSYVNERGQTQNFSSEEKRKIYDDLFKQQRNVNELDLIKFLNNEYGIEVTEINGIESKFNSKLATYHDLVKQGVPRVFLDDSSNEEALEDIIRKMTVFEDRKMMQEQLSMYHSILPQAVIKKLERRHYTGWGRLSKQLITGLRDETSQKTILEYLINDDGFEKNINRNFMQLINDDNLTFKQQINKAQSMQESTDVNDVVDKLAGSPAIKKGILQSLKIVDELVAIMGYLPNNIVIEMARENQTTFQGKQNSQSRYKKLEKYIKELGSSILGDHPTNNKALQNEKLYLYYLQDGKDMYTGEALDISILSTYDVDHIIPQSFLTDNSIDNKVLTSSSENRGKSDNVPSEEIVYKMERFWNKLLDCKSISQRKYDNLTRILRGGLTEDVKACFIKRQLVETRQITKNVARILHERFSQTDENVNIITLKSSITSEFRKIFGIYKVREINDYHHANDAYLNGVVAITLLKVYPKLKPEFVYGDFPKYNSYTENKATAKKTFYSNIMKFFKEGKVVVDENGEIVWEPDTVSIIKSVLESKQMNIVKKTEVQKGGYYKETVQPKGNSAKLIPRKTKGMEWETTKYGGFDSPEVAYSLIVSSQKGKKCKKEFVKVTVMEQNKFEENNLSFLENKGYKSPTVIAKLSKYTLFELENGRRRLLASSDESQKGNQFVLPSYLQYLLYLSVRLEKLDEEDRAYLETHREQFGEMMQLIKQFADITILAEKNMTQILSLYEENKDCDIELLCSSFVNLLKFTSMGAPSDFTFFSKKIPRARYTSTKELLDATIIFQSITGLYETRWNVGE